MQKKEFLILLKEISYQLAKYTHKIFAPSQHPFRVAENYLSRKLGETIGKRLSNIELLDIKRQDIGAISKLSDWIEKSNEDEFLLANRIFLEESKKWITNYKCESEFAVQHQCNMLSKNQVKELTDKIECYFSSNDMKSKRNPFIGMQNLEWGEITIVFKSQESVSVSARGQVRRYNYTELGFSDERKGDFPNQLWGFLRAMSIEGIEGKLKSNLPGVLDIENRKKTEKQIQRIRKVLKTFFRISSNPIVVHNGREAIYKYETIFKLKADNRVKEYIIGNIDMNSNEYHENDNYYE